MPKKCPSCKEEVVQEEGQVAIRCPNSHCSSRQYRSLLFFVKAMDIEHIGDKVLQKLMEMGYIHTKSDIYQLTKEMLALFEGFKEKSIANLLQSIEASKKTTLARFIFSLGIDQVGISTAEILAQFAKNVHTLFTTTKEELESLEGIGPVAALAIATFFHNKIHQKEIEKLLSLGVKPAPPKKVNENHPFFGKTFVITGTFTSYTREELERIIKEAGGKVSSSVSGKTDYLLLGENPGSKYEEAKKRGVAIFQEKEFLSINSKRKAYTERDSRIG